MRSYLMFAAWFLLAGAGIPLIGVLNSGVARSVGNPFAATAVMFALAAIVAFGLTLPLYGHPTVAQLASDPQSVMARAYLLAFMDYPPRSLSRVLAPPVSSPHSYCSASYLCRG